MDSNYVPSFFGLVGLIAGALITKFGDMALRWREEKVQAERDKPRRDLLKQMLEDRRFSWRELDTLMHVIGSDEATTKRLLLDIGARGSEDGKNLWGLIARNPFKNQQ